MTDESLHIRPLGHRDHVPIPVTFYLSPEIFADEEAAPADYLADLMKGDLAYAINYFRKAATHPSP
jgi:hypothetical protein